VLFVFSFVSFCFVFWFRFVSFFVLFFVVGSPPFLLCAESALGDRTGFLFFTTMFWIMQPWFNALYSCTHPFSALVAR
jgi:hypothetical protein